MKTCFCAYDKTRVCDSRCAAHKPQRERTGTGGTYTTLARCIRGGFDIAYQKEVSELREWLPEMKLPNDGIERKCKRCGNPIEPAMVTAGHVGSGRVVIGGWYSFKDEPGPYCPPCAQIIVMEKAKEASKS